MNKENQHILTLEDIRKTDVALVGGKNASLGEMFSQLKNEGVQVPAGFALTAAAFWYFLEENKIKQKLARIFAGLDSSNIKKLEQIGRKARNLIVRADFPQDLEQEIIEHYQALSREYGKDRVDVAVRSSATAEDLPTASFAGQHETYLNVRGKKQLLTAIKKCIASLFTDRAIAYRNEKGFDNLKVALSVGVQKMVRSDKASSGVMFTLDTETGFDKVVLINSIWGVGEMIVKGRIIPDEFYVFKGTLSSGHSEPLALPTFSESWEDKAKNPVERARNTGSFGSQGSPQDDTSGYKPIIVKNLGRKHRKYVYSQRGGLKEARVPRSQQLKFSLTDEEVLTLARWGIAIEKHYGWPQDIEWAKDGETGELFVVQSRPETVHSAEKGNVYREFQIKTSKKPILQGIAIGNKIGQGRVRVIKDVSKINQFQKGEVLVTTMTDPDWGSIFPLASAIITDEGGKTCHAAIVARELGVPCIVGTDKGSRVLKTGQEVTVDCTQGLEGRVFEGKIDFDVKEYDLKKIPDLKTDIMVNIGAPEAAFQASFLPVKGVGLAREEFIIAEKIRVHPLALYHYEALKKLSHSEPLALPTFSESWEGKAKKPSVLPRGSLPSTTFLKKWCWAQDDSIIDLPRNDIKKILSQIEELTVEHKDKREYFVKELAEGVAQIAAAFYPRPVILRFSDFKTNEYRGLIGGELFEPADEANPMLGFRGASRYYDEKFKPAFLMECEAIKRVRDVFGLKNIKVMVPFCRTVGEGKKVLKIMQEAGLKQRKDGLEVYVMCEIPSNVILADQFLDIFDGMSIGSNDLTQFALGIDRDNARLQKVADERNPAVKKMISQVIELCNKRGKYCGICGQAPSDFPEFARFLMERGIKSISLNPDTVMKTILELKSKIKNQNVISKCKIQNPKSKMKIKNAKCQK